MNQEILDKWNEIQELILHSHTDLEKTSKGNKAAGVRFRKQIKQIEASMKQLKKLTLQLAKEK